MFRHAPRRYRAQAARLATSGYCCLIQNMTVGHGWPLPTVSRRASRASLAGGPTYRIVRRNHPPMMSTSTEPMRR